MKLYSIILISLFFSTNLTLNAMIKVASVLGDNMVLQRNSEVKIWGKADPNKKITIVTGWNKAKLVGITNDKGEWLVKSKTSDAGGPYTITIAAGKEKVILQNILLGEVWLCSGQSNMEMPISGRRDAPVEGSTDLLLNAENASIRLFTVSMASKATPADTCNGKWDIASAESVSNFSAVGYLFAKHLQQILKIPVGIICSSWGGSRIEAWMKKDVIAQFPDALRQTTLEKTPEHQRSSHLYNGMIAPLLNYTIKGVLWYQGEANIGNYKDYTTLQVNMVKNWRDDFSVGEFPFYYVQIAPFYYTNSKARNAAFQREAQYNAMSKIPNSGMVTTFDLGEEKNNHPADKETVSKRLVLWALAETYKYKGIPFKSPTYKNMVVKDSLAVLTFDNIVNGLTSKCKEVECFEIAGSDSIFYPAKVNIQQRQTRVYSPYVKVPVAVRYGFYNFAKTNGYIYNTAGLPVIPFRTDNWEK